MTVSYRVYRDGMLVGTTSNNSFNDSGLVPNTEYTYTVEAINEVGMMSPMSDPVLVTTLSAAAPVARGPLLPGRLYWGACGHLGFGGTVFATTPYSQQIADLKYVFGNEPFTIVYRAFADGQSVPQLESSAREFKNGGIIPISIICTYPNFGSFRTAQQAYTWAYNTAALIVSGAPSADLFEIGNEWEIHNGSLPQQPHLAASWRGTPFYQRFLAVTAGAIAAIRDRRPNAAVIGGATAGWDHVGLVVAMGVDLKNYNGRDLSWDYSCLHWYDNLPSEGPPNMGDPENFAGDLDAYEIYAPIGRPIAVTEFGSAGSSAADGGQITGLMDSFLAHAQGSPGVSMAAVYELYQWNEAHALFHAPGSVSPAGRVVKDWVAQHANGGGPVPPPKPAGLEATAVSGTQVNLIWRS